ncbi:MAG: maleylpyruvate isomerase family mycothiol-dependent enzyme [Acidimicrobiia bacterium]|nr:maleylpyruvate isomerase family mycothiol-dependent enzyme [Acidimicrobiia bacterium]
MAMRAAAELLALEAAAIEPILQAADDMDFDLPTVCTGWSVRDVMAHCAAALSRIAADDLHDFSPEANEEDVEARRGQSPGQLLAELITGYEGAAEAIDSAGGALDGIGLGEWIHGGDIRDALGLPGAYESGGIELAIDLLIERSHAIGKPAVTFHIGDNVYVFGVGEPQATLSTDRPTFVRICGGRQPDPQRYRIDGEVGVEEMVLFS